MWMNHRHKNFTAMVCATAMGVLLSVPGCSQTDLWLASEPLTITAELCAPADIQRQVPYKVLFIIDTSGSNTLADPMPAATTGGITRRQEAVLKSFSEHLPSGNVSFGIVTFSNTAIAQTFGFEKDTTVLTAASENVGSASGATNYSDALWIASQMINADIQRHSAVVSASSRYLLHFVSDGLPTRGVTKQDALAPFVASMLASFEPLVADISFSTAYLGGATNDPNINLAAQTLLQQMAEAGKGTFTNIGLNESIAFKILPIPITENFIFSSAVVTNMNVAFDAVQPVPDSDGDGLSDRAEWDLGLDPTNDDTDGDGVRDGIEFLLNGEFDPTVMDAPCGATAGIDTDGDLLWDCEEDLIGTTSQNMDTDGDLLPDGVEYLWGGRALDGRVGLDSDVDGFDDVMEIRTHLNPQRLNTGSDFDRWGYQYKYGKEVGACGTLTVTNVGVFETLAATTQERGFSRVLIFAAFETQSGDNVIFRRADVAPFMLRPHSISPDPFHITLNRDDFITIQ